MEQIKRGEIYYANLCPVVGSEQGGIRPVVILQNDKGNLHSTTTIVAPITGELDKPYLPTHVIFKSDLLFHYFLPNQRAAKSATAGTNSLISHPVVLTVKWYASRCPQAEPPITALVCERFLSIRFI